MNDKTLSKAIKVATWWKQKTPQNTHFYNNPYFHDVVREDLELLSLAVLQLYYELQEANHKLEAYDDVVDTMVVKSMVDDLH